MTFIIYTTGNKNEIVGFELKNAEEKITAYFNNNDEFEFKADETLIKGTKINNELNVSIIEKNTEYAKLKQSKGTAYIFIGVVNDYYYTNN